jgi:hypothetical protein
LECNRAVRHRIDEREHHRAMARPIGHHLILRLRMCRCWCDSQRERDEHGTHLHCVFLTIHRVMERRPPDVISGGVLESDHSLVPRVTTQETLTGSIWHGGMQGLNLLWSSSRSYQGIAA